MKVQEALTILSLVAAVSQVEAAFPEEVPAAEAEEAGSLLSAFFIIDFSQLSTQSVRNIKPPAMRVRKRKFATKYTFHYNRVVQATIKKGRWKRATKSNGLSHTKWMYKYYIVFTS